MIRPARMKQITIAATQKHRNGVIDALHENGFIQIKKADEPGLSQQEENTDEIRLLLNRAEKLIGAHEEKKKKGALKELITPERCELREMGWKETRKVLVGLKEAEKAGAEIDRIKKELLEKKAIAEQAGKISALGVDVSYLEDSELLKIIPMKMDPENLEQLEKRLPENAHLETSGDIAILIGLKENEEGLKSALKGLKYETIKTGGKGKPSETLKKTLGEIKELEKKEQRLEREKEKKIERHYPELLAAREALRLEKEKREITRKIGHTERTFVIEGWVPAKDLAALENALHGIAKEEIAIASEEPLDAPVKMENPRIVRPFEMVTEMFSLPKYNSMDPTFLMAPMFALFFGLMLTDAVYGLFMLAGAILVRRGIGSVNRNARDLADILILCGISTIGWGILTAGYLGDLPKYMIGKSSAELAIWVDPLADPIAVLAVALAIGVIHLNIGIAAGIWDRAGKGEMKAALKEKGPWVLLETGLLILGTHRMDVMHLPQEIGYALIGTGIAAMVLEEGLFGVMRPIEISGGVLSYARLLALALSTAGIAMTVNMLSSMVHSIPIVGGTLMMLIFVLGHAMNMTMNGLGAFIHSMRLHFVEFFGIFYEGGGEKFTPFKAERRYTKRT